MTSFSILLVDAGVVFECDAGALDDAESLLVRALAFASSLATTPFITLRAFSKSFGEVVRVAEIQREVGIGARS